MWRLSRLRRPGGTPQLVGRPPATGLRAQIFQWCTAPALSALLMGLVINLLFQVLRRAGPGGSPRRPGLPAVRRRALPGRPPGPGHPPAPPVPPALKPLCKRPAPCYDGVKLKKGADVWEFGLESSARAPRWPSPDRHVEGFLAQEGRCTVAAVCSRTLEGCRRLCVRHGLDGVRMTTRLEELLDVVDASGALHSQPVPPALYRARGGAGQGRASGKTPGAPDRPAGAGGAAAGPAGRPG